MAFFSSLFTSHFNHQSRNIQKFYNLDIVRKLTLLLFVALIFSCSSDDSVEQEQEVTVDSIIGNWELYRSEKLFQGMWINRVHLVDYGYKSRTNYVDDNTYTYKEDPANPSSSNDSFGTWENLGDNQYHIISDPKWNLNIKIVYEFHCENQIKISRQDIDPSDGTTDLIRYYNKLGYDPTNCNIDYVTD